MTIQPSGAPLWLRGSGITQYGGDLNKKDYGGIGAINARTDLSAVQYSRLVADMASLARVSPLMRMQFTPHASAPVTSVELCSPCWGVPMPYADGAAPPSSVYPTITGTGALRTIILSPTATDDYSVIGQISPKIIQVSGGTWDGSVVGFDSLGTPFVLPIALGWGGLDIVSIH
jgi:hypothetical protein